jgi:predicted RNA-binding Zn-ribbon protein involved in translation (DUF1610 family)
LLTQFSDCYPPGEICRQPNRLLKLGSPLITRCRANTLDLSGQNGESLIWRMVLAFIALSLHSAGMQQLPDIFCFCCHNVVKPTKALTNYSCPSCGATIIASRVEQPLVKPVKIEPPPVAI